MTSPLATSTSCKLGFSAMLTHSPNAFITQLNYRALLSLKYKSRRVSQNLVSQPNAAMTVTLFNKDQSRVCCCGFEVYFRVQATCPAMLTDQVGLPVLTGAGAAQSRWAALEC